MKFGKLPDISSVDFRLPPDPEGTRRILQHLPERAAAPLIYVGATGWGMKEWVGKWYPKGTSAKGHLPAYGRQFNTIELNTTHYRIPDTRLVRKWRDETPADFRFCPKIPQIISHSGMLGMGHGHLGQFMREIKGLGDKMGCCFMQLPPYFRMGRLPILERFLGEWDTDIPLAVEVRHADWFANAGEGERLFSLLEKFNIQTVITDVAGRRDVLHNRLTGDVAMIRFVGNGLHKTDYSRVDEWVERLASWFESHLRAAYFFTHEPDNILSPELAAYLVGKLKTRIPHAQIRGPKEVDKQMSLF